MHAQFDYPAHATYNPATLHDGEIIEAIKRGNPGAFEIIMRRYNQRLYRIARSIMKNDAEAEDIVQETYIKAYTLLCNFNGPHGFSAWLSKIAINESLMRLRKTKRIASYGLIDSPIATDEYDELASSLPDPERLAENHQFKTLLEAAIDALPDDFRTVFILRAVEQLNTHETADYLGIKAATVKTRFHRARQLLQEQLNNAIDKVLLKTYEVAGNRCDRIVAWVLQKISNIKI